MDISEIAKDIEENASVLGDLQQIFTANNQQSVKITPNTEEISEDTPLTIPIYLSEETEMAQIKITSPEDGGAIKSGFVDVEYMDEQGNLAEMRVYINETVEISSKTLATSVFDGRYEMSTLDTSVSEPSVLVINLGARVVVKSIAVTVTAVENQDGSTDYVAIQQVNFIQDMVPENPQSASGLVEGVVAITGNESIHLSWDKVPNIASYRVSYGTSSGKYTSTANSNTNSTTLSGLDNFTTYYIVVQSVLEDWSSSFSSQISATPEPTSAPSSTNLYEAEPFDQGVSLKWQSNKNASSYSIWAKKTDSAEDYTLRGTTSATSYLLGSLENLEKYSIYVTCNNKIGSSKASNVVEVVPEKENVDGPILPTSGKLPATAVTSMVMNDPTNYKKDLYPNGFDPNNVFDQDFSTDWVADVYYYDKAFTFTFDQPYDMSYLIYVAKVGGRYHESLHRIGVEIWDETADLNGNSTFSWTDYSIKHTDLDGENYCVVDFPRTKVAKIKISAAQWDGSPTNVSASEIVFYEHNGIDDDIADLFADNGFFTLKEGINAEKIQELRVRVEDLDSYVLNKSVLLSEPDIADRILQGEEPRGYVKSGLTSIDSSKDDPKLSNISPLGLISYGSSQITVYADIPDGETVSLIPSQYYAEAYDHLGSAVELEPGRNVITVEKLTNYYDVSKGGTLYYQYSGDVGDKISLHFDGWYQSDQREENWLIPVLELYDFYDLDEMEIKRRIQVYLEQLTSVEWEKLNNPAYNPMNATEISLRNVLLSLPASEFLSGLSQYSSMEEKVEALYHSVLAWEELLMVTNVSYGLDDWENPRSGRQNIRYMRMSDAFMYAAGNHIGIQYGSVPSLAKGTPSSSGNTSLFGWGIAHEIGHNLDRMSRPEITNNIYSLLAQTWDGEEGFGASRLGLEGRYDSIFQKVTSGNLGIFNNVFTQLGMYWQLQQAYCGENPLEFYNLVNKEYKSGAYSGFNHEVRFALIVSLVVERDLQAFFTAWGVTFPENALEILKNYENEERLIQYFDDDSREYRLTEDSGLTEGEFSLTALGDEENFKLIHLEITHNLDENHLSGFEIYRNGDLIAYTTNNSYTDTLGALNNRAIEYSVKAVDKRGNYYGLEKKALEFRLEYDDVIDSKLYSVEKMEDGFKITFENPTTVSGILLKDAPKSGEFTVSIAGEDGEYLSALVGDFGENDVISDTKFINYFNKPNVDSSDTRIGVYDATEIIITGLESAENLSFLGYIGDNISFMDTPVGILQDDFFVDDSTIIEAGTIVILGEYLGDPYFNEITLMGRFAENHGVDGSRVTYLERAYAGTTYMFAYDTETVSTISDGLFLFVPDLENEQELQGEYHSCDAVSLLPYAIKGVMTLDGRNTSDTTWIDVPNEDSMPLIVFE